MSAYSGYRGIGALGSLKPAISWDYMKVQCLRAAWDVGLR